MTHASCQCDRVETDDICRRIVICSFDIHRRLGPGLLESAYQSILEKDLVRGGLSVESQKRVSVEYEGIFLKDAFVADLVVEGKVVVEIKSVVTLLPVHYKQLLTYLRLLNLRYGLLVNFGGALMQKEIKRVVNGW